MSTQLNCVCFLTRLIDVLHTIERQMQPVLVCTETGVLSTLMRRTYVVYIQKDAFPFCLLTTSSDISSIVCCHELIMTYSLLFCNTEHSPDDSGHSLLSRELLHHILQPGIPMRECRWHVLAANLGRCVTERTRYCAT